MSKFLKTIALALVTATLSGSAALANGDVDQGEKVFKKCKACHAVGEGAKNKIGPQLNDLFGRVAGSIDGFKYSKAMIAKGEEGTQWDQESLAAFLSKPKSFVKGTKMSFAGIKKQKDIDNLLAYLGTFSATGDTEPTTSETSDQTATTEPVEKAPPPKNAELPTHGTYHLGRMASEAEIAAWNHDVRPDGEGLPDGRGTVLQGEEVYVEYCASCHGDFGEGAGRWPVLAGGQGSLQNERPVKTIGSYWPYLSTVYDYVQRAMPFGQATVLSDDEVYAVTAYLLYLNDIVTDEEFELSNENFNSIEMPNAANFYADDRANEPQYNASAEPCMVDCKAGPVEITKRAQVLDVTPDQSN
jgi:cytochrome c2